MAKHLIFALLAVAFTASCSKAVDNTTMTTSESHLATFLTDMKNTIELNRQTFGSVTGYQQADSPTAMFLRDHTYAIEGMRYFTDNNMLVSMANTFVTAQRANGGIEDYIYNTGNTFGNGDTSIEPDNQYVLMMLVFYAWQANGDTTWMTSKLPALDNAWDYAFSNSDRYDAGTGLVKRDHSISMWDFNTGGSVNIASPPHWEITTEDIAGYYAAAGMMAKMYEAAGDNTARNTYITRQTNIKSLATTHLWDNTNSRFVVHKDITWEQSYLGDDTRYGVAANAYALAWGLATDEQAAAALSTFKAWRTANTGAGKTYRYPWPLVAPGYSPSYGGYSIGSYANGGLLPLTGTHWVIAAFKYREYDLAWAMLQELIDFYVAEGKKLATSYQPDGSWSTGSLSGDGWNCGAYLTAVIEELIGVKSVGKTMDNVTCFPKWNKIGQTRGVADVRFPASNRGFHYDLTWSGNNVSGSFGGDGTTATFTFSLAANTEYTVRIDGSVTGIYTSNQYGEITFTSSLTDHTLSISSGLSSSAASLTGTLR